MIQEFTVSRDEAIYEAFPDVAIAPDDSLVCVFLECTHHIDRPYSRIMLTRSSDRGRTWGPKRPLTDTRYREAAADPFWDCPRITALEDGRLAVVVDEAGKPPERETWEIERNWLWLSDDAGETWTGPERLPVNGIVPDQLVELETGDRTGRWILSAGTMTMTDDGEQWTVRAWYSDDQGGSWTGPRTIAADPALKLCEPSVVELPAGELVCFMRENSKTGRDCYTAISEDGGETWDGVYRFPITACHRPVGGMLESGRLLVTHRHLQGGAQEWGTQTQNTFAALTDVESCLARSREDAWTRLIPITYDRSEYADLGYTGWVQFDDGEVYVVDYTVDDAPAVPVREPSDYDGRFSDRPKGQIRGYAFDESDLVIKG